jgi:hypothetical protein
MIRKFGSAEFISIMMLNGPRFEGMRALEQSASLRPRRDAPTVFPRSSFLLRANHIDGGHRGVDVVFLHCERRK